MMRKLILLMCMVLAAGPANQAMAQLNFNAGNMGLKNFTLTGNDPKGQSWQLHGDRTKVQGSQVIIENFRLQFKLRQAQGGRKTFIQPNAQREVEVILSSTNCRFNSATKEIKSEAPVCIHIGKNIYVTGIGYDIDIDRKVILIRSAVTASMQKLPKNLSKKRN